MFILDTWKCYGYEDYVVLQVLCYVITLIKTKKKLIHGFMQSDNMVMWELAQNKRKKYG
jgi:hypothetical protein